MNKTGGETKTAVQTKPQTTEKLATMGAQRKGRRCGQSQKEGESFQWEQKEASTSSLSKCSTNQAFAYPPIDQIPHSQG